MDIAPIVGFRVVIGLIGVWEVSRYLSRGFVRASFVDPSFHFTYYGFGGVRPVPGEWMFLLFAGLGAVSACVALGLFHRVSATLFFLGWSYVFLLDQARYLNHQYLFCLLGLLLLVLPAHRARSVDAWLNPAIERDTAPAWTLFLLRFQIGVVYVFGGLAKVNADWLRGQPMGDWLDARHGDPILGALFEQGWAGPAFSWGGLLLDLFIVPALLWKPTRAVAAVVAVAFHALNSWMFDIGIFPWVMIFTLPIFFDPSWLRRWFVIPPLSDAARAGAERESARGPSRAARRLTLALLGLYCAVQVLMPLRHWLYPGDVAWTEEGHRFAWRMKLRSKSGEIAFFAHVSNPTETVEVNAAEDLRAAQIDEMLARPDMIHQYAHLLAERYQLNGRGPARITVRALVALNDREPSLLVDPEVDLGAAPRTLGHAAWITSIPPIRRD